MDSVMILGKLSNEMKSNPQAREPCTARGPDKIAVDVIYSCICKLAETLAANIAGGPAPSRAGVCASSSYAVEAARGS